MNHEFVARRAKMVMDSSKEILSSSEAVEKVLPKGFTGTDKIKSMLLLMELVVVEAKEFLKNNS